MSLPGTLDDATPPDAAREHAASRSARPLRSTDGAGPGPDGAAAAERAPGPDPDGPNGRLSPVDGPARGPWWSPPPVEPCADAALDVRLRQRIDRLTKPLGALGRVEALMLQLGLLQGRVDPRLEAPQALVFAASPW